jgi:hypothetical protein
MDNRKDRERECNIMELDVMDTDFIGNMIYTLELNGKQTIFKSHLLSE